MKYRFTEKEIKEKVEVSFSLAELCRNLDIKPIGGNYRTLKSKLKQYNIDTSHFRGKGWNIGLKFRPFKKYTLDEILIENSTYTSSDKLRKRLLNEGIKKPKCEICNNNEWLGKPIKLELHHVNGINTDNRLFNLKILCPNCHSFTDTYRKGKSALSEKKEVEYRKFKEILTGNADDNLEPSLLKKEGAETIHDIPKSKNKVKMKCNYCDSYLTNRQKKYCSTECYIDSNKGNRPSVFELLKKFQELNTFVSVGKYYNVSDNAVRKWCSFYGILDMVKK